MPRFKLLLLLVFVGAASARADNTPLQLVAEMDGRLLPLTARDGRMLRVSDEGKEFAVSENATWRLAGDIRAGAELLSWSPPYSVSGRLGAKVFIPYVATRFGIRKLRQSPFVESWPEGIFNGGVVVAAWLDSDGVIETNVFALPPDLHEQGFFRQAVLSRPLEDANLQPVLLLWRDGEWVPPEPLFGDPVTEQAMVAAVLDDVEDLTAAIAAGARLKDFSRQDRSLAHYAAEAGALRTLVLLAEKDKRAITRPNRLGVTPLHLAAAKGRLPIVEFLIEEGAKANALTKTGDTPLDEAMRHEHQAVVRSLLTADALPPRKQDWSALFESALEHGVHEVADVLFRSGIRYDFASIEASQRLIRSARSGHGGIARWLAEHGTNPNYEFQGQTPLLTAVDNGDRTMTETLIAAGAYPNQSGSAGRTPLMVAGERNHPELATLLLAAGADPNNRSAKGETAMHAAARQDAVDVVRLLCDAGADLSARDNFGQSALEVALIAHAGASARELVGRGATIDPRSDEIRELLIGALQLDILEPLATAAEAGWSPNTAVYRPWSKWYALDLARIFHARNCEAFLVELGATTSSAEPPSIVSVDQLDQPLTTIKPISPFDPRSYWEVFPRCEVLVESIVVGDGQPLFPIVLESPDTRLNAAAMAAINYAQFTRPTSDGKAVATRLVWNVEFRSSEDRIFEIEELDDIPFVLTTTTPNLRDYPGTRRPEGSVKLVFVIWPDGSVGNVRVESSHDRRLDDPAIEAILQWKFKPGKVAGRPVFTLVRQELMFGSAPTSPHAPLLR